MIETGSNLFEKPLKFKISAGLERALAPVKGLFMSGNLHSDVHINLEDVSFSRRGSWLSITPLIAKFEPYDLDRHYIKCHHHDAKPVIELIPEFTDPDVKLRPAATPTSLLWKHKGQSVEAVFDGTDTIRIKGTGDCRLSLSPRERAEVNTLEADHGNCSVATFNILPIHRKFQIERLSGHMSIYSEREAETGKEFNVQVNVSGESWEIAVDLYVSVWTKPNRASFDICKSAVAADFSEWLGNTPPANPDLEPARKLAAYITWSATVKPHGLLKRDTMLMSKNYMCRIWSWDHCFNALALASNSDRTAYNSLAWDQMLVMADEQDEFGGYPDAYNDTHMIFNYTKPPIHGWTLEELQNRMGDQVDETKALELFHSIENWTNFWLNHRRLEANELAHYMHGYDSGWDNATMFDEMVPVISPDLNTFLIVQCDALASFAKQHGFEAKAKSWKETADALYANLIKELWDGEKFTAKGAVRGETITSDSLIYCMPILLGDRLPGDIKRKLVSEIKRFITPYGLATEHPDSPKFMDDGYWRGPIWGPSTYLFFSGLLRSGFNDLATDIAKRFCSMCKEFDFAENHHALTGERLRDRGFTWTASSFLLMAEYLHKKEAT
ncbi:amylo-alpha-1,6-glucosidase [Kordiimonas laminariae]|uniref:amylo-alpha-1,6-glucosidase n=1 Tax=Kordiimonas laminariae TaxID=2917717 RepID=UPI001FF68436|nr:trehalase family glycosidase [Kordiimonas laminariae]MCK0068485.1 hypothetical protein [Kordiimonas laminariae]